MTLHQRRPREKDAKYLNFIRSLPCCICLDDTATEAAHIRTGALDHGKQYTGKSEKASDKWTLPLCNRHHREQHMGNEMAFWSRYNIDPFLLAISLQSERRS